MSKTYRYKTRPWDHQVTALKRSLKEGTFCLNMEMRTGKSKVAIDYIACQHLWKGADTVLILTPKSVIGRWFLEIHTHLDRDISSRLDIRVLNYERVFERDFWEQRKRKKKKAKTYHRGDKGYGNPEYGRLISRGWDVVDNRELLRWARKAALRGRFILILDEAHIISNASSAISRKTFRLARMTGMVLSLTGTPFDKQPFGVFGQWKMLDPGVFGTSMRNFRAMYAIYGGYGDFQVTRWVNLDHMAQKIAPKIYTVKEEDCWDIPRSMDQIIPVEMEESSEVYNTLADEAIVDLHGETVEASLAITLALRLHQATGGFLRNDSGKVIPVGREKQRALVALLEQLRTANRDKLVVFARFLPELAVCARSAWRCGYRVILFHGGVPQSQRDYRIACFEEWEEPTIFISQIATGSMGLELSVARDEIFYSHTNSLVHYNQARARIRGHKQKKNMTYWHLCLDGTIDPAMLLSLERKKSVGRLIQEHPEMLRSRFVRR